MKSINSKLVFILEIKNLSSKNPKDLYAELDKNIPYYVKDIDNDIYQYYLIYLKFIHDYDIYSDETENRESNNEEFERKKNIDEEFERKKNIRKLMKYSLVKAELESLLDSNLKKIDLNTKKIHVSRFLIEIHQNLDEIINKEKEYSEINKLLEKEKKYFASRSILKNGKIVKNVKNNQMSNLHKKFLENF